MDPTKRPAVVIDNGTGYTKVRVWAIRPMPTPGTGVTTKPPVDDSRCGPCDRF
jgi:hypothetical protein